MNDGARQKRNHTAKAALPCTLPGLTAKGDPWQRPSPLTSIFSLPCGVYGLCRPGFFAVSFGGTLPCVETLPCGTPDFAVQ
jgi:hypothetical protein